MSEPNGNGSETLTQRKPSSVKDEEVADTKPSFTLPALLPSQSFWERFTGKGRRKIGWTESLINIVRSSWLNALLIIIPLAWAIHFTKLKTQWPSVLNFLITFWAIVPLAHLFEYGGEQMAFYLGKDVGDLVVITLNNTIEVALAIILLLKCELKLLQCTIIGVVVLHLLLIPGIAFIIGGARIWEQDLHPHKTELNHTLLTLGVMGVLLPAAFFAALDQGPTGVSNTNPLVSDATRGLFLKLSRGLAVILLFAYIGSRIFLHHPPGDYDAVEELLPHGLKREELRLRNEEPELNPWACLLMLAITVGITAATAEWLVDTLEIVRTERLVSDEWFGIVVLPLVSFSSDGAIAVVNYIRCLMRTIFGTSGPPATIAKGRAIDLSIQFTLFWMPFLVLLGWWTSKPMSLLFDLFEVTLLVGACFLVNYVTADAKTNWAEGLALVAFYLMIALCAWFYPGQIETRQLLTCSSVGAAEVA